MQFSVIYSVDCPEDENIARFAPPDLDLWDQTEGDERYEYGYLEDRWENGSHRKWCAILDREQFDDFVQQCGLIAESTETMGSLGAPGFGFGWAPAISFTSHDSDAIQSAYVTPIPEVKSESFGERNWERVRGAVRSIYG
jgi:hypothetical protein